MKDFVKIPEKDFYELASKLDLPLYLKFKDSSIYFTFFNDKDIRIVNYRRDGMLILYVPDIEFILKRITKYKTKVPLYTLILMIKDVKYMQYPFLCEEMLNEGYTEACKIAKQIIVFTKKIEKIKLLQNLEGI